MEEVTNIACNNIEEDSTFNSPVGLTFMKRFEKTDVYRDSRSA